MVPRDSQSLGWPEFISKIRARTPARILAERAGAAYRTPTQLELRQAHAAARDAVRVELDLERDLGRDVIEQYGLFEVSTRAGTKDEYLSRPDLGRQLNDRARELLAMCPRGPDLQIVIGDGLSVTAMTTQIPNLLPLVAKLADCQRWKLGQPFVIRHCRVGALNEIGELLDPRVVVLLIGERPGLATAESLSAYMAYRPRPGHTDADRNLISNIHSRGVPVEAAAERIVNLARQMMKLGKSGVMLKEKLSQTELPGAGRVLS